MNISDKNIPVSERLYFVAAKLDQMWGRNPDSLLIREAAGMLAEPTGDEETAPKEEPKDEPATQTKPKGRRKGTANADQ